MPLKTLYQTMVAILSFYKKVEGDYVFLRHLTDDFIIYIMN